MLGNIYTFPDNPYYINDGYNFINFLLVYSVGRYLSMTRLDRFPGWAYAGLYLLLSLTIGGLSVLLKARQSSLFFFYNNPLVIVSSVMLFCCFATMKTRFKWVAAVTPYLLSVYLMQGAGMNFYDQIRDWNYDSYVLLTISFWLFCTLLSFLIPLLVEYLRALTMGPLVRFCSEKLCMLTFRLGLTDKNGFLL